MLNVSSVPLTIALRISGIWPTSSIDRQKSCGWKRVRWYSRMIARISSTRETQRSLKALSSVFCLHHCICRVYGLSSYSMLRMVLKLYIFSRVCARVPFSTSGRAVRAPSTAVMHRRYSSLWDKICSHPSSASLSTILKSEDELNRSGQGRMAYWSIRPSRAAARKAPIHSPHFIQPFQLFRKLEVCKHGVTKI